MNKIYMISVIMELIIEQIIGNNLSPEPQRSSGCSQNLIQFNIYAGIALLQLQKLKSKPRGLC